MAPPFYRTRGFVTVVALGLTLLLALAWWLRMRALRQRYALVFAERARVSREIHDTLLQSLAALGVEIEAIASQLDPHAGLGPRRAAAAAAAGGPLAARRARVDPRAAPRRA